MSNDKHYWKVHLVINSAFQKGPTGEKGQKKRKEKKEKINQQVAR